MIYQNYVSYARIPGFPGDQHNNDRHASIFRSSVNTTTDLEGGVAQVKTGLYDHTRLLLSNPTAANMAAPGNYLVIVARSMSERMLYNSRTPIGATVSNNTGNIIPAGEHVRAMTNGTIYVVVEKAINPNNGVYVRVSGATTPLEGIGFFSDVASPNHVLVPNASWYGTDAASFVGSQDFNYTPALVRSHIGMTKGYSHAPLALRFGASV